MPIILLEAVTPPADHLYANLSKPFAEESGVVPKEDQNHTPYGELRVHTVN